MITSMEPPRPAGGYEPRDTSPGWPGGRRSWCTSRAHLEAVRRPHEAHIMRAGVIGMAKTLKKRKAVRNVVHQDSTLRKASDYLEFDIHSIAAGLEMYLRY